MAGVLTWTTLGCLCLQLQYVHGQPGRVNYMLLSDPNPSFVTGQSDTDTDSTMEDSLDVLDLNTTVVQAKFDTSYTLSVNLQQQYLFIYKYNETSNVSTTYGVGIYLWLQWPTSFVRPQLG